jgi:hypothetical protein
VHFDASFAYSAIRAALEDVVSVRSDLMQWGACDSVRVRFYGSFESLRKVTRYEIVKNALRNYVRVFDIRCVTRVLII